VVTLDKSEVNVAIPDEAFVLKPAPGKE